MPEPLSSRKETAVPDLPNSVEVVTGTHDVRLATHKGDGVFTAGGARIEVTHQGDALRLTAEAPPEGLSLIVLRWRVPTPADALVLGDAWERAYGDLQWRPLQPDRPLPWYALVSAGFDGPTTGWGVRTRAGAMCAWTVAHDEVTLWADLRSGALPVRPGRRVVDVATVVTARADSPFAAHRDLSSAMSPDPLLPAEPVVGCNNWYYAYGKGFGPNAVLRDARTVVEYADGHPVRPYCVIDDGWTEGGGSAPGGPWDRGLPGVFDDMADVAARIRETGARPGLWFRPLLSSVETPATRPGTILDGGHPLDPSTSAALDTVTADVSRFRSWGYELLKHDFSTYDVTGRFASGQPARLVDRDWTFADRSRTTAEILVDFYRAIARAADGALVIGCNTVGHLAAGLVHLQRVGDDTSGRDWRRTRRMGVNALAFRLAQHGRLFHVDADCVPCTPETPWSAHRQYLDLVARSGTALFVSVDPAARTAQADDDLSAAVRRALDGGEPGGIEPLDWQRTTVPRHWAAGDGPLLYDWSDGGSGWPYPV
ncbi:hypothetical protein [Streptomyces sp. NPDC088746]|uniref:hypothetical protein n=1 Tax=Streptomyces sp. NPDC088746 TaxID=3365885 RepID=UPI0037F38153